MDPKRIAFFVLIGLVVAGYWYFSQPAADQPARPSAVDIDSISAPERPTITAQKDTTDSIPAPPGEPLSPGTAQVKATILTVEGSAEQPRTITIRVDEVLGYGSSTPPLPTGTELDLQVKGYLESNPKFREQVQQDNQVELVVASQQGMALEGTENQQRWALVEFKQ